MQAFAMYRRRLIPNECILLKDDRIVSFENGRLVTVWSAIRPKKNLHHGISCFFFDEGIKLSKFYREDGSLVYWYIDIIHADLFSGSPEDTLPYSVIKEKNPAALTQTDGFFVDGTLSGDLKEAGLSLVVTDLLADILIYPDGFVKVVDLAELSDALGQGLLDEETVCRALRIADRTLEEIYAGDFKEKQEYLERFE